jgi:hypothetical protein
MKRSGIAQVSLRLKNYIELTVRPEVLAMTRCVQTHTARLPAVETTCRPEANAWCVSFA